MASGTARTWNLHLYNGCRIQGLALELYGSTKVITKVIVAKGLKANLKGPHIILFSLRILLKGT